MSRHGWIPAWRTFLRGFRRRVLPDSRSPNQRVTHKNQNEEKMQHDERSNWTRLNSWIARATLVFLLVATSYGAYQFSVEQARRTRATASGKYSSLMQTLYVPGDVAQYGKFCDYGFSNETQYRQYKGFKPGHWVYVAPNWYQWENCVFGRRD